ncbi:plasmid pRiA4b ORF-3 family protein [Lentibacillus halophilus]|uniref:Plasmid pRiA4b ORF-3 family protein n=1 Tax=Lentibacillus halophilus TaxID=295065 RepID=A0ABN0Z909_9BACI
MKAYQIRIELADSDPLIWRRVVMPAGATFYRLHQVIQTVTNFRECHLFAFELPDDNLRVTNDEEAYEERLHYKKHWKEIEQKMEEAGSEFAEMQRMQLQQLRTVIRKPSGIKVDSYLEKYGTIAYTYDYGDGWTFSIILEDERDDHYYVYPVLIDGAETAPPEDVGGLPGFYEFLTTYYDTTHPDHDDVTAWAQEQLFREYNPDFINSMLKFVMYKKTEWDKLNG